MQENTACAEPRRRLEAGVHMNLTSKPASLAAAFLESRAPRSGSWPSCRTAGYHEDDQGRAARRRREA